MTLGLYGMYSQSSRNQKKVISGPIFAPEAGTPGPCGLAGNIYPLIFMLFRVNSVQFGNQNCNHGTFHFLDLYSNFQSLFEISKDLWTPIHFFSSKNIGIRKLCFQPKGAIKIQQNFARNR